MHSVLRTQYGIKGTRDTEYHVGEADVSISKFSSRPKW